MYSYRLHGDDSNELRFLTGPRDDYGTLKSSSASRLSTDSIIDDQTKYQTALYASKVNETTVYKQERRDKRWEPRNIARMFAGIPFAIMYGAALYFILRFIILDEPYGVAGNNNTANTSAAPANLPISLDDATNSTEQHVYHRAPVVDVGWGSDRADILYGSAGFTVTLATLSVFSRTTRCSMLLMLPCLITGRSRYSTSLCIIYLFDKPGRM